MGFYVEPCFFALGPRRNTYMEHVIYNEEARHDPVILEEIRCGLLGAAAIGQRLKGLVDQLIEVSNTLQASSVPGFETQVGRVQAQIRRLRADTYATFDSAEGVARNPTALGNIAARHHGVTVSLPDNL